MAKGKRTPQEVWEFVGEYIRTRSAVTAPDVARAMERDGRFPGDLVPSDNTILKIINKLKDESPPWHLSKSLEADAALVLPVVAALIEDTDASIRSVSEEEARWITAVKRAEPRIPELWAFYMARHYIVAASQGLSTDGHDRFLALHLWEDDNKRDDMVRRGVVPLLGRYVFLSARLAGGRGSVGNATIATLTVNSPG